MQRETTGSDYSKGQYDQPIALEDLSFDDIVARRQIVEEKINVEKPHFLARPKRMGHELSCLSEISIVYEGQTVPLSVESWEVVSRGAIQQESYRFTIGGRGGEYVELNLPIEYGRRYNPQGGFVDPVVQRIREGGVGDLPKGIGAALSRKVGEFIQDIANQRGLPIRVVITHRDTGAKENKLTHERWLEVFKPLLGQKDVRETDDPYGSTSPGLFYEKIFHPVKPGL